ncbi:uncharacterized protein LOC117555027 [Gymnodraco acuticeps]|uniref:Uncharacterized protein LOC117555027 n=1 Tax=Gymnodraco acuticeps TaxID=8218 RepID=A0A6P8VHY8_GYMAC|nr:uncharacterized protein LOC117555027 [Gymnodraco acuticeps]
MTYVTGKMDEDNVLTDSFSFGFGRGKPISGYPFIPVRGTANVDSPAFCSTRLPGHVASPQREEDSHSSLPDTNDAALNNLITHIAQQVGQTIRDQLRGECEERGVGATPAQSGVGQLPSDHTYLNLTGAKLVLQSDVREPPVFRGDGSDKNTVCEWEELMGVYFRKRATPLREQHIEIMSKLMGKAKDIVRITLRSCPSMKPQDNPQLIYDILRQHFSDVTYSCMPMADFYSTVPVAGESSVEYWLRLNKAVDAAEEGLKRLGRKMEDSCQEVAMMFVKYCPDPTLAAVFKFKAPDKWTASEIQEHIDRYQTEMKEQVLSKSKRVKPVTVHVQVSAPDVSEIVCHPREPSMQGEDSTASKPSCNDDCMKMLVSLFDRALSQNNQVTHKPLPSDPFQPKACRVCQSLDHSTLAHCRQKRLCLVCFEPNHIKKNCPNRQAGRGSPAFPPQNSQPLN